MSHLLAGRVSTFATTLRRASRTVQCRTLTKDGRRLVLGIESSCDDSAASLVSAPPGYDKQIGERDPGEATLHVSIVIKQDHGATHGIEPLNAAKGHAQNLPKAITAALGEGVAQGLLHSASDPCEIDAVAVTQGPGMTSCLFVGMIQAKLLAALWHKPLLYVHHMVAHALTPLLTSRPPPRFPFLVFLLSGGHTQAVLCQSPSHFRILATSNDNSIGSAFDKAARQLAIPVDWTTTSPGAALEKFASSIGSEDYTFPSSMMGKPEFTYSGLLVTVQRLCERLKPLQEQDADTHEAARRAIAYAFQGHAFRQIQDKLRMALKDDLPPMEQLLRDTGVSGKDVKDVVVSGGVASNETLRRALDSTLASIDRRDVCLHFPPVSLCTDNAAMIAHAGLLRWNTSRDLSVNARPRWSIEDYP